MHVAITSVLDEFLETIVPDDVPLLGVAALVLLYVLVCNLVIDFIRTGPAEGIELGAPPLPCGMSHEELRESPCFQYGGGASTSCCVICLDGFEYGDRCRIFPLCKHVFHKPCIDLWLLKRLSCPTCRSSFKSSCNV